MQSFIVLGIIPGTNIQTTLNFWLVVTILFALIAFRRPLQAFRGFAQRQLIAYRIARTIDACELRSAAA
jgi:hypothetical protein